MNLRTLFVVGLLLAAGVAAPASGQEFAPEATINITLGQLAVLIGDDLVVDVWSNAATADVVLEQLPDNADPESDEVLRSQTKTVELGDGVRNWGSAAMVTFEAPPAGYYRVRAVSEGAQATAWTSVSDLVLISRGAGDTMAVWSVQRSTGQPVQVNLQMGNLTVATGADGLWIGDAPEGDVRATSEFGPARLWEWKPTHGGGMAAYTDRPIYRPGQDVHVRGIVWDPATEEPAAGEVEIKITRYGQRGQEAVAQGNRDLDVYGGANFGLALAADAALGTYQVQLRQGTRSAHASFEVEEYRLPEYRVDLATAGDGVAGEAYDVLVKAARFYGEPIDAGEVTWNLQASWYSPCFSPWYGCGFRGPAYERPERAEGRTELQPDGTALLRLQPEAPGTYTLRATVQAPTGEHIDASVVFTIHPADMIIKIKPPERRVAPDEIVDVAVEVTDASGGPLSTSIKAELETSWWLNGGRFENTKRTEAIEIVDGHGVLPVKMPDGGSVNVQVVGRDGEGRETTAWTSVYGGQSYSETLEIVADTRTMGPGEPARFHLSGPNTIPTLVVFEGERLLDAVVAEPGQIVSFDSVPRSSSARAVALQWLTIEPSSDDQKRIADGQLPTTTGFLQEASATVQVEPPAAGLGVKLTTDWDAYDAGDTARVLLEVTDAYGTPTQASVDVRMVDEALLALREDLVDVTGQLLPPLAWGQSRDTVGGGRGGIGGGLGGRFLLDADFEPEMGRWAGAAPPVATMAIQAPAKSAPAPVDVREYFPETGFWATGMETDANGVLRLDLPIPDTFTTWHIDAVAVSKDAQVGEGEATLVARADLVADILPPRFLVDGDEVTIMATVSNHMSVGIDVQALLEVEGVEAETPHRTASIGPGRTALIPYNIRADDAGEAVLTFYAWSPDAPEEGDALRLRFSVHHHGTPSRLTHNGQGDGGVTITIPASADDAQLTVALQPGLESTLLDALPYLISYPHGCVEQTLSSFMPLVAVAHAIHGFGLDADEVAPDLEEKAQAGLERLYNYQHPNGAWGWWESDPDNPFTTAYVIYGMQVARDAGIDVDEEVFKRGREALARMIDSPLADSGALRAYQMYALSQADPSMVVDLPQASTPGTLAMRAMVAAAIGDDEAAAASIANMKDAARVGGQLSWPAPAEGWTTHGITSETMVTSFALRAMLVVDRDDPDAGTAARWLASNRDGHRWGTTKDTAEAILGIVAYTDAHQGGEGQGAARVEVDGVRYTIDYDSDNPWERPTPVEISLTPGDHDVSVSDAAGLWWSAEAAFFEVSDQIKPAPGPFKFERRVTDDNGRRVTSLAVGDEATVEVTVGAGAGLQYVRVTDPLPAGVEVVDDVACFDCLWLLPVGWSAAREVRDDSVSSFYNQLEGQMTFSYRIRGVWAGDFAWLPTSAEPMYDASKLGHGASDRFTVLPDELLVVGRVGVEDGILDAQVRREGTAAPVTAQVRFDGGVWQDVTVVEDEGVVHALVRMEGTEAEVRFEAGAVAIAEWGRSAPQHDPTPLFGPREERVWAGGGSTSGPTGAGPQGGPDTDALPARAKLAERFAAFALDPLRPDLLALDPAPVVPDAERPTATDEAPHTKDGPGLGALLVAALAALGLALRRRR